jgi:hypothetical protein
MERCTPQIVPIAPTEVGSCYACGGVMYDFEQTICPVCCMEVHRGCREKCSRCGDDGCKFCMVRDPQSECGWKCSHH